VIAVLLVVALALVMGLRQGAGGGVGAAVCSARRGPGGGRFGWPRGPGAVVAGLLAARC